MIPAAATVNTATDHVMGRRMIRRSTDMQRGTQMIAAKTGLSLVRETKVARRLALRPRSWPLRQGRAPL
jgi:hypothetical protein